MDSILLTHHKYIKMMIEYILVTTIITSTIYFIQMGIIYLSKTIC